MAALNNDYSARRRAVEINGTKYYITSPLLSLSSLLFQLYSNVPHRYYLNVVNWSELSGIDWNFVMLLEQKQFLGNSHTFFVYVSFIFSLGLVFLISRFPFHSLAKKFIICVGNV